MGGMMRVQAGLLKAGTETGTETEMATVFERERERSTTCQNPNLGACMDSSMSKCTKPHLKLR
eukprot:364100-Chlamydomonas_euryale.AAC.10